MVCASRGRAVTVAIDRSLSLTALLRRLVEGALQQNADNVLFIIFRPMKIADRLAGSRGYRSGLADPARSFVERLAAERLFSRFDPPRDRPGTADGDTCVANRLSVAVER